MKKTSYHPFRSARARERFLKEYDARAVRWPVVSEARTLDTSFGPTFVRVSGKGTAPALVLLHGAGGNSLQWMPNIEALSGSFRVFAVDNIHDNGRSINTRPITSPDDFVCWLDELFTALDLGDRINLMGLSYGGWMAGRYALHCPARLNKIVLLAPASTVLPLRKEFMLRAMLCLLPLRFFTRSFLYWLCSDFVRSDQASRDLMKEASDFAFMAFRSFKPRRVVWPTVLMDGELEGISVPTFFLVGENEKIYHAREAVERLNRVAPRIKTDIIPGAGHDLTLVQADVVNAKVLDFLR